MSDKTIQTLEDMKITVKAMDNIKGKQALITRLSSSILFLTMHKVDGKTAGLIVAARQKDIDNLGSGKEYKQAEIDWRAPKHLRDSEKYCPVCGGVSSGGKCEPCHRDSDD